MPIPVEVEGDVIALYPHQIRVLEAQIRDGADTVTVARRAGISRNTANRILTEIAAAFGLSRMEMVVGFVRGDLRYELKGRREDLAA